jgi:tetratricopeptide (TPR) repeat protein
LLGGDEALPEGLSPGLKVRLRWQQARLLLEEGTGAEALAEILTLEEDLREAPFTNLPEDLLLAVRRYLLLMRGEAHFRAGNPAEGRRAFAELRSEFPRSGPAVLSYLVESRSASNEDNLVSAQQSLIDLVDRFPDSRYAPIALWEAALKAEQRGLSASLQEAVNLLERLVTTYPDHELVFYARLKQGDLARRLNDFPTAMLLYENLLQAFPDHPEQYRAELSRADCLLALGGEDPARYDQAALLYERNTLLPTVPLPARLEAGYKWAQSLRQQGDLDGCEAVLFLLLDRFVENVPSRETLLLRHGGRYWMARAMLDLAALLAGSDRPGRAGEIYEKLLKLELPGSATARSRLADLELSSPASNP